jgi:hypothetical protein
MLSVTYKPFMLCVIMRNVVMLSVIILSVIMLSVIYAECRLCWVSFMLSVIYAECHFAERCMLRVVYAECHYAECRGVLFTTKLDIVFFVVIRK